MTTTSTSYDLADFLRAVRDLLAQKDLNPQVTGEGAAYRELGASKLLSGFGITPTVSPGKPESLDDRGNDATVPPGTYLRADFIVAVEELLMKQGLKPQVSNEGFADRTVGAAKLLSGFGITPLLLPVEKLDLDGGRRYNTRMHGD
jgi:hypothetical protein